MRSLGLIGFVLTIVYKIRGVLMNAKLFSMLLFFSISLSATAQMVAETSASYTSGSSDGYGQSFTATATGNITRITVRPIIGYSGDLHIYNGATGSGSFNVIGTPVYSQSGVNLAATGQNGSMVDIVLSTPFPVLTGQAYTFVLGGESFMATSTNNPYAGGNAVGRYGSAVSDWDLAFEVWITTVAQNISFTSMAPASVFLGGGSYTVAAKGGASRNPVVFSIDPSANDVCSISGAVVIFNKIGICTINANQNGNTAYDAATQVQQSITVAPIPAIPTLSQLGIIVLAGLFAFFGVMKRRSL